MRKCRVVVVSSEGKLNCIAEKEVVVGEEEVYIVVVVTGPKMNEYHFYTPSFPVSTSCIFRMRSFIDFGMTQFANQKLPFVACSRESRAKGSDF
jgi:hypothetical protein